MSSEDYVFAIRRGFRAPIFVETWAECQQATSGFSRPLFRKIPREHAARYLQFERDQDATDFAFSVSPPAQRRKGPKGKGKGKGRGGGEIHGGHGGRGGGAQWQAAQPAMGPHPPIPPTGMPPLMGMPTQAPFHMGAPPGEPTFIHAGLQTMGMPPAPFTPETTGTPHAHNPFSTPAHAPPPTPAHAPAPAPVVAYAPAPAPAPHPTLVDGHSTAQWKNSSAFHEYHAKQLTVQVHELRTSTELLRTSTEQLRTSMHEAVRAESESRANNETLVAKDARMQQVITEKTVQTTKLNLEAAMQGQLLQAAEASRVSLQLQLDKANADKQQLEKSCLRLMNTVEEKEKEIAIKAALRFTSSSSTAMPPSPLKKLKTKKKKVKPASKDADDDAFVDITKLVRTRPTDVDLESTTRPTDVELEIQARKAFPIEYGDSGPERLAREYEISLLYEQLVSARDGTTAKLGKGFEHFVTSSAASTPTTRHLADIFSASTIDSNQDEDTRPSTPSSELDTDDHEMRSSSGATTAEMLLRLDNEHWDKHGRPHPDSAFQTSKAPAKPKKKTTTSRRAKAAAKKPASKLAKTPPAKNSGDDSDDDIVDMTA